jgi:hypothetical protein
MTTRLQALTTIRAGTERARWPDIVPGDVWDDTDDVNASRLISNGSAIADPTGTVNYPHHDLELVDGILGLHRAVGN